MEDVKYTLKTMTKEAFRQKIEDTFKSTLPLSVFNILDK